MVGVGELFGCQAGPFLLFGEGVQGGEVGGPGGELAGAEEGCRDAEAFEGGEGGAVGLGEGGGHAGRAFVFSVRKECRLCCCGGFVTTTGIEGKTRIC